MGTEKETQMGRPSSYSTEIRDKICDALATTKKGFAEICNGPGMPGKSTGYRWMAKFPDFWEAYTRARDFQTEQLYDDMNDLVNMPLTHNGDEPVTEHPDGTVTGTGIWLDGQRAAAEVNRRKLMIDVMKFKLVKLQPKRFGDRKQVDLDVQVNHSVSEDQFQKLLQTAAQASIAQASEDEDDFEDAEEVIQDDDIEADLS